MDRVAPIPPTKCPALAGGTESLATDPTTTKPQSPPSVLKGGAILDAGWFSAEERLSRIGSILYRAACRQQIEKRIESKVTSARTTPTQQRILAVIRGLEFAAPEQILPAAQTSRASLARHLRALLEQGLVVRTGLTRQTRYSLPAKQRNVIHIEHDSPSVPQELPAQSVSGAEKGPPAQTRDGLDMDFG